MLPKDAFIPLALFMALLLSLALHGLVAGGHFPREHRATALVSGFGRIVLYGSVIVAIVCMLMGIVAAARLIPWYAAIIGGGLAILCAPLLLQQFPDAFVDGLGSLLTFAGASAVLALLLIWFASGGLILLW